MIRERVARGARLERDLGGDVEIDGERDRVEWVDHRLAGDNDATAEWVGGGSHGFSVPGPVSTGGMRGCGS